jgi:phosphoserine phosphatase
LFQEVASKNYWISAIPAVFLSMLRLNFGYKLRLSVKKTLYKKYLKGVSESRVHQAGTAAAARLTVNNNVMDELKLANERGETVIIATASPRIYVTAILDTLKVHRFKVIGTEFDFRAGRILGEECSQESKWRALTKELQGLDVGNIAGYGNAPDDIFMLEQVNQGFLIKGLSVSQYKS